MLGFLKNKVSANVNKYSGKTDFLEAVCAAAALIAAADGEIEDEEITATMTAVKSHPSLSQAFSVRQIETTMETMLERTKGRAGRMGLYREIDDIAADPDMSETVYLVALDVSESDGEIEPEEEKVLARIASSLKIDPSKYDV